MKINVVTLGCSKNTVDSEVLMYQLKRAGWQVLADSNDASARVVLINTCGFIGDAKEESVDTIMSFVGAKQRGLIDRIYVMGCLVQRYRHELAHEIPEVDGFFGVNEMPQILNELKVNYIQSCKHHRLLSTPRHYAYLKISEGCSWHCAYCAIPLIRGPHVSRSIESLIDETQYLVSQGVKEIIVIAQDSTFYGMDLYGERRLAQLLQSIAAVKGVEWVRLHYAYPADFPLDVLDVMASNSNICRYLDLPVQHISNHILQAMHRRITREQTLGLIEQIRQRVPGIALRSTLLVGFPGETPADFDELMRFVESYRLDRLGVFAYSCEEGTPAASLPDDVPAEVKQLRLEMLMELQSSISLQNNKLLLGTEQRVLVDTVTDSYFTARTEFDSPDVDQELTVTFSGAQPVRPGDFVRVRIVGAMEYDLQGELIG